MDKGIINLSNTELIISYVFTIFAMVLTSLNGINKNKEILIGTLRMTIQLFIAGFILVYILDSGSLIFTLAMLAFMEISAVFNIVKPRLDKIPKRISGLIAMAMLFGSLVTLSLFMIFVIKPEPIYNPQYLIPLACMIMGNSMNGISLALDSLIRSINDDTSQIEGALMLGSSPAMAMKEANKEAFDIALTPTLNSMKNMGLITLPGMMTGQILGGNSPMLAIKYQIAIMTVITSANTISIFLFLKFAYKHFFNKESQLKKLGE